MRVFGVLALSATVFAVLAAFQNCAEFDGQGASNSAQETAASEPKATYLGSISGVGGALYPCLDKLVARRGNEILVYDSNQINAPPAVVNLGLILTHVEAYKIGANRCVVRVNFNSTYSIVEAPSGGIALAAEDYAATELLYGQYLGSAPSNGLNGVVLMTHQSSSVEVARLTNVPPGYEVLSSVSLSDYSVRRTVKVFSQNRMIVVWSKTNMPSQEADDDQIVVLYEISETFGVSERARVSIGRGYDQFLHSGTSFFGLGPAGLITFSFKDPTAFVLKEAVRVAFPQGLDNITSDEHGNHDSKGPVTMKQGTTSYVIRID